MKKNLVIPFFVFWLLPIIAFAQKIGGNDIIFKPVNAGPVLFSHEKHISGKELTCSDCHYRIFQMQRGSYKMNMTMISKGEFCGKCHNGKDSFDVKDPKNCQRCHKQL